MLLFYHLWLKIIINSRCHVVDSTILSADSTLIHQLSTTHNALLYQLSTADSTLLHQPSPTDSTLLHQPSTTDSTLLQLFYYS